jgi:hypothetical protein
MRWPLSAAPWKSIRAKDCPSNGRRPKAIWAPRLWNKPFGQEAPKAQSCWLKRWSHSAAPWRFLPAKSSRKIGPGPRTIWGIALKEQALRTGGTERMKLLAQALAAFRSALEVYTREALPEQWEVTQSNLRNTLKEQARSQ